MKNKDCLILIFILITTLARIQCKDYRLPTTLIPISYTILITINDIESDSYSGSNIITFKTKIQTNQILLHSSQKHIRLETIYLNGDTRKSCKWNYETEEVININCGVLLEIDKVHSLMLDYVAIFSDSQDQAGIYKIKYKSDNVDGVVLLSRFAPSFARRVFPCFDEPGFKAVFNFFVDHPSTHHILGSTPVEQEVNNMNKVTSQFSSTEKIPPSSIAFALSKFEPITKETNTNSNCTYFYNGYTKSELKKYGNTMLRNGEKVVEAMEKLTGIKYPEMNSQLIFVTSDNLKHDGNNLGLIISREEDVLDEGLLTNVKQKRKIVLKQANQIAHQWFGNYVTVNWWTNLWISNGFVKYLEYLIADQIYPEFKLGNDFFANVIQEALYEDAIFNIKLGDNEDISELSKKSTKLMTNKGASIIRMMGLIVGKANFGNFVRSYIAKGKNDNITPDLLLKIFNMENKMTPFLLNPGFPLVKVQLDEKLQNVHITQETFAEMDKKENFIWNIPITYTTSGNVMNNVLWLNKELKVPINSGDWIVLNNQHLGYYRVNYDNELWNRLINLLKSPKMTDINTINRAQLIDDIFALAKVGKIEYEKVFSLVNYISHEKEYLPWFVTLKWLKDAINQISDEDTIKLLKSTILGWINKAFPLISINKVSDPPRDVLKEMLIIEWKCFLGDSECIETSIRKYRDYKLSKNFTDHNNEKDIIICYSLKYTENPLNEYSFLMKIYQDSASPVEKESILTSLGCIKNIEVLNVYLNELIVSTSVIPKHKALNVFEAVSSNSENGVDVALEFLEKHIVDLNNRLQQDFILKKFLNVFRDKISTKNQFEKMKSLVNSYGTKQDDLLKIIENNLVWAEKYTQSIQNCLEHLDSSGFSNFKIPPLFLLIFSTILLFIYK